MKWQPRLAALLALAASASAQADAPPRPTTISQATSFIGTAINVADRERSLRFYTEGLGLTLAATIPLGNRSETILRFPGNSAQASLLLMHDPAPGAPALLHGNAFSRLVLRVVDLAALAVRLDRMGYAHGEIREAGQAGYRIMMLSDPDGFRIELVQQSSMPQEPSP